MAALLSEEYTSMKDRILQMLRENEGFLSGQEICKRLSVSRTAVWKGISQLREEGYRIEAVNNKGYRLLETPDVMYEQELKSILHTKWFGSRILYFDSVDSTNNELKRQAEKQVCHGMVAVAEEQTAGRGRRGHNWVSPPGTGIWISFLLTPDIAPDKASMLTLVAALAVSKAIHEVTGLKAEIKWPNDIVVNKKKVCGMLTELSAEMTRINYVVIGIGINVNTTEFSEDIKDMATSLYLEAGKRVNRAAVIEAMGRYFEQYYDEFIEAGDLSPLTQEYNELLVNAGKQVKVIAQDDEMQYRAVGINAEGELIVEDVHGTRSTIRSGEVSVRGLYGYV